MKPWLTSHVVIWRDQTISLIPTVFFLVATGWLVLQTDGAHYANPIAHVLAVIGALSVAALSTWALEQWLKTLRTR